MLPKKVLIISNNIKKVLFLKQRAGDREGNVLWDYHVVLLAKDADWMVWDLDTRLPFPCPVEKYISRSFPGETAENTPSGEKEGKQRGVYRADVAKGFAPLFKVVEGDVYRKHFSSNRKHMRDKHGRYAVPPPPWRMINPGKGNTFCTFIDMHDTSSGRILDAEGLLRYVADGAIQPE